jgi:hypothetical protein
MRGVYCLLFMLTLVLGCTSSNVITQNNTLSITDAVNEIIWLVPDAKLVSITGTFTNNTLDEVTYVFDSINSSKSYSLNLPEGRSSIRQDRITLKTELINSKIDVLEALSACSMTDGVYSLEMIDSVPTWNIISEEIICSINGVTGERV